MDAGIVLPEVLVIALCFVLLPAMVIEVSNARRTVTCPHNGVLVPLRVSRSQAVRHLLTDCPHRVDACARWPEQAGCDQACTTAA
jgi:hypothetical protein